MDPTSFFSFNVGYLVIAGPFVNIIIVSPLNWLGTTLFVNQSEA
jgi:hypothetical protein